MQRLLAVLGCIGKTSNNAQKRGHKINRRTRVGGLDRKGGERSICLYCELTRKGFNALSRRLLISFTKIAAFSYRKERFSAKGGETKQN